MKRQSALNWLVPLVAILALGLACAGLFWPGGGGPYSFTTLHGQTVQMDGHGLYRNDTLFSAGSFRGTDVATILAVLPLLAVSFVLYRRKALKGVILLTGALSCLFYNSASMAFGAAYNNLFLVYIAYFSTSLAALVLSFLSFDLQAMPAHIGERMPWRGIGWFQIVVGVMLSLLWLSDIAGALIQGQTPVLIGSYTTMVTYVLDIGGIAPLLLLSGVWTLRRNPLGLALTGPLLILNALVGAMIILQTIAQLLAGVSFTPGQLIAFIGSFVVMSLVAISITAVLFRNLKMSGV